MRSRFWYLVSILCFLAAVWFWLKGNEEAVRRKAQRAAAGAQPPGTPGTAPNGPVPGGASSGAGIGNPPVPAPGSTQGTGNASPPGRPPGPQGRFPYRLSNTEQPLSKLGRSDTAILLDNAFIDTSSRMPLGVPEHLRAPGDPGSYIVQSGGPLDGAYY